MNKNEDVFSKLSKLGYRMTPQRMLILNALLDADGHISAEELYSRVRAKYPHLNISTIYRTLELLKSLDLATATNFGGGRVCYHAAEKGCHHHLICQKCGKITELHDDVFEPFVDSLAKQYKFVAELRHVAISGRCLKCSKQI